MADKRAERLLVVDDEDYNRDMLERRLARQGFDVVQAGSGPEALAALDRSPVDLVLLDVMMPGQSGIDVLRQIRRTRSAAELPVMMVTACDQTEEVVEALRAGANDYLTKPVNFPVMLARLSTQLTALRASRSLRESEERYMLAARGSNDGLWDWDLATNEVFYSTRWKRILGYDDDTALGTSPEEWFSRVHPADLPRLRSEIDQHLSGQADSFELEHRVRHRNGSYRWVSSRGAAVRGAAGTPTRMAGSLTDLTASKVSDALTGLPNRLLFHERLEEALSRVKQDPSRKFAILCIDVDRFKIINDGLGHGAGDQLLVAVTQRLRESVRHSDTVAMPPSLAARFGGDEFGVLITEIASAEDAMAVAQRMLEKIHMPYHLDGQEVFVTVSIGIAIGTAEYENSNDLLRDADTAMYRAKALGKGRVEVFDHRMHEAVLQRLRAESDLRRAVERNQFLLHYQPIYELPDQRLIGFEALLRWKHPERGMVPPNLFIPVAEESGAIVEIGQWVLDEACRQLRAWQDRFPQVPALAMSVNVSGHQLRRPDFPKLVAATLEKHRLSPATIRLEITETALMDDAEGVITTLRELKAIGTGLQIDDFGTGYSSLSYVDRFPVDTVKIDRSFVSDLPHNTEHAGIVQAVLTLARTLGMSVTAEGVETVEQLEHLRSVKCNLAQGYYFSRPLPAADIEKMLIPKESVPSAA